jgi:glycerol-3-phosphate dehydrogenase (NAD(P)+)
VLFRSDPSIAVTADPAALAACNALVLAAPAQHLRAACRLIAPHLNKHQPLIVTAKGIETGTYRLMSEVVQKELPENPVFILSGPSFADEVARGLPTALTLAGEQDGSALALAMSAPSFRLYTTDDIVGTQIGGALKNVLAIACGIVAGRELGENARAALITRGLAGMARLGLALGARAETISGLSGVGDVMLTCSSPRSRNTAFGIALGRGASLEAATAAQAGVVEGAPTAAAALGLARRHGVELPIISAVDRILREQAAIDDIIAELLARPLRAEPTVRAAG